MDTFSRFTHFLNRAGYVAAINSLRMKPVFVRDDIFRAVCIGLRSDPGSVASKQLCNGDVAQAVSALRNAKVLVPSADYDDRVLQRARSDVPPPSINLMYLILTDRCNFECTYCFVRQNRPPGYREENMSEQVAQRALSLFARLIRISEPEGDGQKDIILYGGEPLVNFRLVDSVLQSISELISSGQFPRETAVSLITNGSLLTPSIARTLANRSVSVGVSLDGDAAANDSNRFALGKRGSAYKQAIQAVKICQDAGVAVGLSVTLTPQSLERKAELIQTVMDLRVTSVGFNILMNTKGEPYNSRYSEAAADFMIDAFKIFREKGIREDRICRKVDAFCQGKVYLFDCGAAGGNQVVVAPDGSVGICHAYLGTRKYFISSGFEKSFDPSNSETYREWNRRTPINIEACLDCVALGICGGGCPFNADILHGTIWGLDDRFCVHARRTTEWLIWETFGHASADPKRSPSKVCSSLGSSILRAPS